MRLATALQIAENMVKQPNPLMFGFFKQCLKTLNIRREQIEDYLTLDEIHTIRKYYAEEFAHKKQRTG